MSDSIVDLIAAGELADALSLLLDDWRVTRHPRVGRAIEELGQQVSRPLPEGKRKERRDAWADIAADRDDADINRLFESALSFPRTIAEGLMESIASWEPDPRLSTLALECIASPPNGYSGSAAQRFWFAIAKITFNNADVRHVVEIEERMIALKERGDNWCAMVGGALSYTQTFSTTPKERPSPLESRVDAILAAIRSREPTQATDVGALFDAVYAAPTELGPKAVLSDALLELGDPRGEFIALQLQANPDRESRGRMRRLLDEHWREWLGPLEAVIRKSGLRFEAGFPHAARIHDTNQNAQQLIGRREWSTIRDADLGGWRSNPTPLLEPMTDLEVLSGTWPAVLIDLVFPRLRSLSLRYIGDHAAMLPTACPSLEELRVHGTVAPPSFFKAIYGSDYLGHLAIDIIPKSGETWWRAWLDGLATKALNCRRVRYWNTKGPMYEARWSGERLTLHTIWLENWWPEAIEVTRFERVEAAVHPNPAPEFIERFTARGLDPSALTAEGPKLPKV